MYARPICLRCKIWMSKLEKEDVGVAVLVGVHNGHVHADISTCTKCGYQIIHKFAQQECFCDAEIKLRIP